MFHLLYKRLTFYIITKVCEFEKNPNKHKLYLLKETLELIEIPKQVSSS